MSTLSALTENIQHDTLPLYNLSCGGGGSLVVERALAHIPGVISVYVNPSTEMVYISYDADQCTYNDLALVIMQSGFGPTRTSNRDIAPDSLSQEMFEKR